VADVVRVVWESLDYVCAERLTPVLVPTPAVTAPLVASIGIEGVR